ncbi:MAG: hypothetical protein H7333_06445 [Bdellovibrionales bacterium]|nr:hypothetical protein [Oligoflexia bacterium]
MKVSLLVFALFSTLNASAQVRDELPPVEVQCRFFSSDSTGDEMNLDCEEKNVKKEKSETIAAANSSSRPSPFSLVIQTGAYAGLISPGIAFRFFKRNEATLLGGFVPGKLDGQQLWQANFKYQVEPFNNVHIRLKNGESLAINPVHLGAGVIYGIHKNLFYAQPAQYPAGYYMPTAIRLTFNVGTSVTYRRVTFYVDYAALDTGAIAYFWDKNGKFFRDNYGFFGLAGIGTLGFGAKFNLNRQNSAHSGVRP